MTARAQSPSVEPGSLRLRSKGKTMSWSRFRVFETSVGAGYLAPNKRALTIQGPQLSHRQFQHIKPAVEVIVEELFTHGSPTVLDASKLRPAEEIDGCDAA